MPEASLQVNSDMPSSASPSATPPPKVAGKKTKKSTKSDSKGKNKVTSPVEHRNEGVDANWAYTPPQGAVQIDFREEDAGQFDWDAVNNDEDVELCLIRIPEAVKPKHLENLTIDTPLSSRTSCIGTLKRKYMTYDLWALGDDDSQNLVGGDEIKGISCLLPRKRKKGKLYPAPKPISRHLVLSAQTVKPTPLTNDSTTSFKNPQRPSHPKELLKHRFMPYGSLAKPYAPENSRMDIDPTSGAPTEDADSQPLVPPSTSKRQVVKETEIESPDKMHVHPRYSRKRKEAYVEITGTPAAKRRKKNKAGP